MNNETKDKGWRVSIGAHIYGKPSQNDGNITSLSGVGINRTLLTATNNAIKNLRDNLGANENERAFLMWNDESIRRASFETSNHARTIMSAARTVKNDIHMMTCNVDFEAGGHAASAYVIITQDDMRVLEALDE